MEILAGVIVFLLLVVVLLLLKLLGGNSHNAGDIAGAVVDETARLFDRQTQNLNHQIASWFQNQDNRGEHLRQAMLGGVNEIKDRLEGSLRSLHDMTGRELDKIRGTVDQKLEATLDRRLALSFKQVDQRLQILQQSLGEMHSLAANVGDLKKVLTNVKTKGILGESRLEDILTAFLAPGQFTKNFKPDAASGRMVEFAIHIPTGSGQVVYLPVDAKLPLVTYESILDAETKEAELQARKLFGRQVKESAKEIAGKYVMPPKTTDFGVLFLPVEGMFATAVADSELVEYAASIKVMLAGPSTLAALLQSVKLGFRSIAIQERTVEIHQMLDTVKDEFTKFATMLSKTKRKLHDASTTIGQVQSRSELFSSRLERLDADHAQNELFREPAQILGDNNHSAAS